MNFSPVLSAMMETATAWPLMKRWTRVSPERLEEIEHRIQRATLPLLLLVIVLPFFNYSTGYALSLTVIAALTAFLPVLAGIVLLLMASPMGIAMLPVMIGLFIISIDAIGGLREPRFSLRQMALASATGILITESLLLAGNNGVFLTSYPDTAAWIGGRHAVPTLVQSLQSSDAAISRPAGLALEQMGRPAALAVSELLNHENDIVRSDAIAILARNNALDLIPASLPQPLKIRALISALTNETEEIRNAVIPELMKAGDEAVLPLTAAMKRDHLSIPVRNSVLKTLRRLNADAVIPALLSTFQNEDPEQSAWVADVLASYGKAAIPHLLASLSHPSSGRRFHARQALIAIRTGFDVTEHFTKGSGPERREAVYILGALNKTALVPEMIAELRRPVSSDENTRTLREAVIWALGALAKEHSVRDDIIQALTDEFSENPDSAVAESLAGIPDARVMTPMAIALTSDNPRITSAAFEWLGNNAWTGERENIPRLLQSLNSSDPKISLPAARELGRVGNESVLPLLEKTIKRLALWPGKDYAELRNVLGQSAQEIRMRIQLDKEMLQQ